MRIAYLGYALLSLRCGRYCKRSPWWLP